MKDLLEQINDLIAPVTRAWKQAEVVQLIIDHKQPSSNEDELYIDVRLHLKGGKSIPSLQGGSLEIQLSNAKYVRSLFREMTKTNAISGEGPKRGVK